MQAARLAAYQGRRTAAFQLFKTLYLSQPGRLEAWLGALQNSPDQATLEGVRHDLEQAWPRIQDNAGLPWLTLKALLEKEPEAREQECYRLIAKAPHSKLLGWPRTCLGLLLFGRGSYQAAIQSFRLALKETPGLVLAQRALARTYIETEHYKHAESYLKAYVQARPKDPKALYNLGWILLNVRQKPKQALPYLERAREVLPHDLATILALGVAALNSQPPDLPQAGRFFQEALALAPKDPDVQLDLGVLYADHLHQPLLAVEHFQRYIDLGGPMNERAARWIRELQKKRGK